MAEARSGYGRGAKLLSIGIGLTGLVTFAFFSVASYVLDDADYARVSLLWSVLFVVTSVLYRPIEQLLARTLAQGGTGLRTPLTIQLVFAAAFVAGALAFRGPIEDVFDGEADFFWVLLAAVVFYAASYFARGYLAGTGRFELYGGLVFVEATVRILFPLGVAVGIASGQLAVALGMAAAPLLSLVVVPLALRSRLGQADPGARKKEDLTLRAGGTFAVGVFLIMLAEQTIINAAVLTASGTAATAAAAGFVFNALLIARAPLQLFQAIQGSLLPHLAALDSGSPEFKRAVRVTVLGIAGFAGAVAVGLLVLGPWAMDLLFDDAFTYPRWGLALVAVGMGFHLAAGTVNQALLARDRALPAAACWLLAAAVFVAFQLVDVVDDVLLRAEVGYAGAAALLAALLVGVARR